MLTAWADVLREVVSTPHGLEALALVMRYTLLVNEQAQPEALKAVVWLEPAVSEVPLYTALSRRDPALVTRLAAFNKGLSELQTTGDLARLLKKSASWF